MLGWNSYNRLNRSHCVSLFKMTDMIEIFHTQNGLFLLMKSSHTPPLKRHRLLRIWSAMYREYAWAYRVKFLSPVFLCM